MPSLILIKTPAGRGATPQTFPLPSASGGTVRIGRQRDDCDIVIDDGNMAVSRHHASVRNEAGKYLFDDPSSRNRSYVNNKLLPLGSPPVALTHEDRVKICDFLFRFHDERALPPAPLPEVFQVARADEADGDVSTVHHSIAAQEARQLLDVQPSDRLRVLLEISTTLARSLEIEVLLPQIADTLYTVFKQADRCFVIQLDDRGRPYAKVFRARRANADDRFSRTIVRRCLETKTAYLSEDASADQFLGAAQSVAEFRIRSVMCVPLVNTAGTAIGAIQLDTNDIGKKFRDDDLKLLTIVANLASVAVEKAQVHATLVQREKVQSEIELAKKVQLGFLPQSPPRVEGYEFYGYYSAAQSVGGDYYDYVPLPGGRIAVVIGDVAGKGVAASLLMAKLSAESRFCLLTQATPARAVTLLNDLLIKGGIGDRFVTLVAAVVDPEAHTIAVVNAGHLMPFKYCGATGAFGECEGEAAGFPLGIAAGTQYAASTITLEPGDVVALFTDGVTDAVSPTGAMFNADGVRGVLTDDAWAGEVRPRTLGERIVAAVAAHAAGRAQNDDIAVVCFGRVENDSQIGPPSGTGGSDANTRSAVSRIG